MGEDIQTEPRPEPNIKTLRSTFDLLAALHTNHKGILVKPGHPFDQHEVTLGREQKGFTFAAKSGGSFHYGMRDISDVQINLPAVSVVVGSIYISEISGQSVKGTVPRFQSPGFDKTKLYYYRAVIPLMVRLDFRFYLKSSGYQTETHWCASCIRINYRDVSMDLYTHTDKKTGQHFMILDTSKQIDLNKFLDYCFSTFVSFGFVTGNMPQDEGYFFAYDHASLDEPSGHFYSTMRGSIKSIYSPIYANAFGYKRAGFDREAAETVYPKLREMTAEEFTTLCQWSFDSLEFSSILLLVVEASVSSLLVLPSAMSVALEGLTEIIVARNEEKFLPIKDKTIAALVRKELTEVVKNHALDVDEEGMKILEGKIGRINDPTNQSKLHKPFELAGFNLTKEDKKAIAHRNDFLHGRLTLGGNEGVAETNNKLYYIGLRLYTLVSVLILKHIGYDNMIVNHPMTQQESHKQEIDEPFFREI